MKVIAFIISIIVLEGRKHRQFNHYTERLPGGKNWILYVFLCYIFSGYFLSFFDQKLMSWLTQQSCPNPGPSSWWPTDGALASVTAGVTCPNVSIETFWKGFHETHIFRKKYPKQTGYHQFLVGIIPPLMQENINNRPAGHVDWRQISD